MPEKLTVYDVVTNRIIDLLDKGVVPWRKSWGVNTIAARNGVTHHTYSGVNWFLTNGQAYASPDWFTWKQAKAASFIVRKGEHATPVTYWKLLDREDKNGDEISIPFVRYYSVWNLAQLDNVPEHYADSAPVRDSAEIPSAQAIVENYLGVAQGNETRGPKYTSGFNRACYKPRADEIEMPMESAFESMPAYYATLFHEMTHSTGHETRLKREGIAEAHHFGDAVYSREELIAEMGSAFLSAHAGIDSSILPMAASYVDGWLKVLRADSKAVIKAAAAAQKATQYILGA